jgi:hypothetical protein
MVLMDFHRNVCESITGHPAFVAFNFLSSVIPVAVQICGVGVTLALLHVKS